MLISRYQMSESIDMTDFRMKFCLLRGKNMNEVVRGLRSLLPTFDIVALPQGSPVTMDLRIDRIRVFYDRRTGVVTSPPESG